MTELNEMDFKDRIWLHQRSSSPNLSESKPPRVLIYFVTGNPGLIEFYRDYLTAVSGTLAEAEQVESVDVIGHSLGGYELHNLPDARDLPLNLQQQTQHVSSALDRTVVSCRGDSAKSVRVVLVGHSVGAYIIMQLIAQRQERQKRGTVSSQYEMIGAINLFPTVVDIARSPSGKKVSPFATSTYLAPILHTISKFFCAVTPHWLLISLIQRLTGHNEGAAKVTSAFLRSNYGVLQALYMGRFELLEMTHDKWSDDVWNGPSYANETEKPQIDRPKLYFYWGENDHWIANSTRDAVIASRARRGSDPADEGKPHMEVDLHGIPHDFCINKESSKLVAEKTAGYIRELLRNHS